MLLTLAALLWIGCGCEKQNDKFPGGENGNETFSFSGAEQTEEEGFVLNTASSRIHVPDCPYAERTAKENRLWVSDVKQALAEGYDFCKHCLGEKSDADIKNEEQQNAKQ